MPLGGGGSGPTVLGAVALASKFTQEDEGQKKRITRTSDPGETLFQGIKTTAEAGAILSGNTGPIASIQMQLGLGILGGIFGKKKRLSVDVASIRENRFRRSGTGRAAQFIGDPNLKGDSNFAKAFRASQGPNITQLANSASKSAALAGRAALLQSQERLRTLLGG